MIKENTDELFRTAVVQEELLRCPELLDAAGYDGRAALCESEWEHARPQSFLGRVSFRIRRLLRRPTGPASVEFPSEAPAPTPVPRPAARTFSFFSRG